MSDKMDEIFEDGEGDIPEEELEKLDLKPTDLADLLEYMDETTDARMERAISKMMDLVLAGHSEKFKLMLIALGRRKIKNLFKLDEMVDSLLIHVSPDSDDFKKMTLIQRVDTLKKLKDMMNRDMEFVTKLADKKIALDKNYVEALQNKSQNIQINNNTIIVDQKKGTPSQEIKDVEINPDVLSNIKSLDLTKRKKLQQMIKDFANNLSIAEPEASKEEIDVTEDPGKHSHNKGTGEPDGPSPSPDLRLTKPILPNSGE